MSISSSDNGVKVQAVSSILNHPDRTEIDNKEDDAALVDSFFLPGGLFSDESNHNNENGRKIAKSNHNLQIGSTPHTTTSQSSVHLPKNPWETGTSNTITAQLTEASTESSARKESLCMQPLPMSLSSTNNNNDHVNYYRCDDTNYNDITGNVNHFNFSSQHRKDEEEDISGTTSIESPYFYQRSDSIFEHGDQNQEGNIHNIVTNRINDSKRVIRPPPGFQDGPTAIRSVDTTYATDLSQKQCQAVANKYGNTSSMEFLAPANNMFPSSEDCMVTGTSGKVLVGADDSFIPPIPTSNQSDLYMSCSPRAFQHNTPLPSDYTKTIDSKILELNIPTCSVQSDKDDNDESNSYLARYLKKQPQSKVAPDCDRDARGVNEAILFPVAIGSKGKRRKSKDFNEDDYGDEDAEADVQEGTEENSLPSFICVSIDAVSTSSSLSTCSDVDNSELSSNASGNIHHINVDDFKDEGVGYDTDQAHVSQIVGLIGNSLCSSVREGGIPDDKQYKSPAPSVNSEGATRRIPSVSDKFLHGDDNQNYSNFTVEKLVSFLRHAVESCGSIVDHFLSAMQRQPLYAMVTSRYARFSRQMRKLSRDLHYFTKWLMDVEEVFAVLLIRLLKTGRKHTRAIIEALTMVLSFLFQLLKFGLIEAIEEFSGVTSCYIAFYLMPSTCVILMDFLTLPHWTPHTVTWLAIFSLCQQVEEGALHETSNISMLSFIRKLVLDSSTVSASTSNDEFLAKSSTKTNIQQCPLPRQKQDEQSRTQDKEFCSLILKTLKTILPVLYMVEGFSSEFGTIIGESCTNRLTTAFVLSILRKSTLSSPIVWISWALQVLLAAFYSSSMCLDILILLIGLSSIRLVRFLDVQRKQVKRMHEITNK